MYKYSFEYIILHNLSLSSNILLSNIGQNNNILKKLEPLQKKALRIINFKNNEYSVNVNELYKTNKIPKIVNYIKLLKCLFVRDAIAQAAIPKSM